MRGVALLPALSLDLATQPVMRGLAVLRAPNRGAAKRQAMRVFTALGATCGVLVLVTAAATTVVVLSLPEMRYPRTIVYERGQNPGPILIEFGPR